MTKNAEYVLRRLIHQACSRHGTYDTPPHRDTKPNEIQPSMQKSCNLKTETRIPENQPHPNSKTLRKA